MDSKQYKKELIEAEYYSKVRLEDQLLKTVNGSIVLENCLKNNASLSEFIFNKKDSLDLILKYKRYDLLENCTVKNLLRKMDNGKRYIDYILDEFLKDRSFNVSFCDPLNSFCSLKDAASIYIAYAKHGLEGYLPIVDDEDLVKEEDSLLRDILNNKRTFIQLLVNLSDETFVKEKFLKNSKYQDIEVLMAVYHKDGVAKANITNDFAYKYSDQYYGDIADETFDYLTSEDKALLRTLGKVAKDKCDEKPLIMMLASYTMYIYKNRDEAYREINKIINVFNNDDTFRFSNGSGSYFSVFENSVVLDSNSIDTLNHEFGHMMLHKFTDCDKEQHFFNILDRIRSNGNTIKKLEILKNRYEIEKVACMDKAKKYFDDNALPYIDDMFNNRVEEFNEVLESNKQEQIGKYVMKGYNPEVVERMFEKTYSAKTFYEQYKSIVKKELLINAISVELHDMQSIGDIVDAIYKGHYYAGNLMDSKGQRIPCIGGHGLYYYNSSDMNIYDEIFANFMSIRKSISNKTIYEDSTYGKVNDPIFALKLVVGSELVDYLEELYQNQILNSPKYTDVRSR